MCKRSYQLIFILLIAFNCLNAFKSRAQTEPKVSDIQPKYLPKFSDIQPIILTKCYPCHTGTGLNYRIKTYEDIVALSNTASYVIKNNIMPPWPPDNDYSEFNHNRSLTKEEKEKLLRWLEWPSRLKNENLSVKKEAPIKNTEPVFLTLEISDINFPVSEKDSIYIFEIPYRKGEDFYVSKADFSSSKIDLIHHCNFFVLEANGKAFTFENVKYASGYSPGTSYNPFPKGTGFLMPGNGIIRGELHIPPIPKDSKLSIQFKFWKAKEPIQEILTLIPLSNLKPRGQSSLFIPKDTIITLEGSVKTDKNYRIYYVNPHMHLLGKSVEAFAIKPDGTKTNLIHIPEWKFKWQDFYEFKTPIYLPKGTEIVLKMTYDNTVLNPQNPNKPPLNVTEGWFTSQEMFTLLLVGTVN